MSLIPIFIFLRNRYCHLMEPRGTAEHHLGNVNAGKGKNAHLNGALCLSSYVNELSSLHPFLCTGFVLKPIAPIEVITKLFSRWGTDGTTCMWPVSPGVTVQRSCLHDNGNWEYLKRIGSQITLCACAPSYPERPSSPNCDCISFKVYDRLNIFSSPL